MDFARVIDLVAEFLENQETPFFLIGGLAMHAYDSSRLTSDVDFLAWEGLREETVAFFENAGYETLHRSSGFSNHLHSDDELGRVNLIYSNRATIQKLVSGSTRRLIIGARTLAVPSAEHLVAMKILAMKNEPRRTLAEMSDIQHLMSLPETDLGIVREYFERYNLLQRYDGIREFSAWSPRSWRNYRHGRRSRGVVESPDRFEKDDHGAIPHLSSVISTC